MQSTDNGILADTFHISALWFFFLALMISRGKNNNNNAQLYDIILFDKTWLRFFYTFLHITSKSNPYLIRWNVYGNNFPTICMGVNDLSRSRHN